MSVTRGRRIAGLAVFLLLFIPACATYRESMETMKKALPGAKPADAESGNSSSTDNAAPKMQKRYPGASIFIASRALRPSRRSRFHGCRWWPPGFRNGPSPAPVSR